jgi:hypothetical protein
MLGIGSKSFYSYNTKSATIESFYNGIKYSYVFFINDEGIPSYAKVCEENTQEENGLKIQFAVKTSDIHSFREEAEKVYKWFSKEPNFIGSNLEINFPEKKYELNGTYLTVYDGPCAIMGNVSYPISFANDALREFECFTNAKIVIEFNIGEVDFSSSRESLAYTQKTILALRKKFSTYTNYLVNYFQTKIDSCSDAFGAALEYEEAYNEILFAISDIKFLKLRAEYKGNKLLTSIDIPCIRYTKNSYRGNYQERPEQRLPISSKFLYCVLEKGSKTRLYKYIKESDRSAYIISEEHAKLLDKKYLIFSSSLPKEKRSIYKSSYFLLDRRSWVSVEDREINPKAYYVKKHADVFGGYADGMNEKNFFRGDSLLEIQRWFGILIIGFNKTQLKNQPSIPPLEDFINKQSTILLDQIQKVEDLYHSHVTRSSGHFQDYYPGVGVYISQLKGKVSSEFLDLHNKIYDESKKFLSLDGEKLLSKLNALNITLPKSDVLLNEYKQARKDATISNLDLLIEHLEKKYVSV